MGTGNNVGCLLASEIPCRIVQAGNFTHSIPPPNAGSETRCLEIRDDDYRERTVCEAGLPRERIRGRISSVDKVTGTYVIGSATFIRLTLTNRGKHSAKPQNSCPSARRSRRQGGCWCRSRAEIGRAAGFESKGQCRSIALRLSCDRIAGSHRQGEVAVGFHRK